MSSSTSLQVGLGASQADIDVQGEIDFDFFEDDATNACHGASSLSQKSDDTKGSNQSQSNTEENNSKNNLKTASLGSNERDLNLENSSFNESDSSSNLANPIIKISCDTGTGAIQKTTIEAVIPTPFNYKDNKCGKISPSSKRSRRALSPRMRSKVFDDDKEFSDDSSLSSMSPSESDLSSLSDESCDNVDETDSMTDVSPLCSPFQCRTPVPKSQSGTESTMENGDKMPKKDGVKFMDDVEDKIRNKCETVDLHELLKAVKRLEMEQNANAMCDDKCSNVSMLTQNGRGKKNLSFSNDEVRRIDNENQRLLKKIIAQQSRPKPRPASAASNLPSSAINRQRQQRQIELENLALLKRLEAAKPSRDLSRFHLLRDYDRRSSATSSRASSRSSRSYCSVSQASSCRTSAQSSGRSSTLSLKSTSTSASRSQITDTCINKPKRAQLITTAHD